MTLPLVLPAIIGGAIITFLEAIALFGSPAMIAIPARYNVVTTQLLEFFSYPVRVEVAAADVLDARIEPPGDPAVVNDPVGRFALWGFRPPKAD